MAVYAIGDVQGCLEELHALLEVVAFDPARDRLWFTGDLVNRGPDSLGVLRYVRGLGDAAVSVLGNHDLHLLAIAHGVMPLKRKDTLRATLAAPDRDALLDWLRHRPLLHRDKALGWTMLHAGLPPQWSLKHARRCAAELEAVLRGPAVVDYFEHMYGDEPARWSERLDGWGRLRFITNCLTRLRYCTADGTLVLDAKGRPGSQREGVLPWFAVPERASAGKRLIFGHWSTLGHHEGDDVVCVDSGCLWGGALTARRLDGPGGHWSVPCRGAIQPGIDG